MDPLTIALIGLGLSAAGQGYGIYETRRQERRQGQREEARDRQQRQDEAFYNLLAAGQGRLGTPPSQLSMPQPSQVPGMVAGAAQNIGGGLQQVASAQAQIDAQNRQRSEEAWQQARANEYRQATLNEAARHNMALESAASMRGDNAGGMTQAQAWDRLYGKAMTPQERMIQALMADRGTPLPSDGATNMTEQQRAYLMTILGVDPSSVLPGGNGGSDPAGLWSTGIR